MITFSVPSNIAVIFSSYFLVILRIYCFNCKVMNFFLYNVSEHCMFFSISLPIRFVLVAEISSR